MPLRDPGDKLYRMGNGFSKMLQMLNFDNNGNVSLSPNIINEANNNNSVENNSRIASAYVGKNRENNFNNIINNNNNLYNIGNNNMRSGIKKRIQSAKPKIRTDMKKNMSMNNNLNIEKNGDEIISNEFKKEKSHEMYPDIYSNNGKSDSGPKITKIIKKTSNKKFGNKDNIAAN